MKNKYFLLVFAFLLFLFSYSDLRESFTLYFNLLKYDYVKGFVKKVEERNSIATDLVFDYTLGYKVNSTNYEIVHISSRKPLIYKVGDSVLLKVSKSNPKYATLKSSASLLTDLFLWVLLILLIIFLILKAYNKFNLKSKWNNFDEE